MVAAIGCLFVAGVVCAAEPFNYFVNDWSVVSLTDYNRGTRISTQNGLVISGDNERKEHERRKRRENISYINRKNDIKNTLNNLLYG